MNEYKRGNGAGQTQEDVTYTYDALNRLLSAYKIYGNATCNCQYGSLGNLTLESNSNNATVDYKYNNRNQITQKTDDGGTSTTAYTYDNRGNLLSTVLTKNSKQTVTCAYVYDGTSRMVQGTNDIKETSTYIYNGLGVLVSNEMLLKKNAYGCESIDNLTAV